MTLSLNGKGSRNFMLYKTFYKERKTNMILGSNKFNDVTRTVVHVLIAFDV